MNTRLAQPSDLPRLNEMFTAIVAHMDSTGVPIWNEFYPFDYFEEDIEKGEMYVLEVEGVVAAAFSLCRESEGAGHVRWEQPDAPAIYFDRFGVSVEHRRMGVGRVALAKAGEIARSMGAEYLRLFVVDINRPAISFYENCGFARVPGVFREVINEHTTLLEYGYEKRARQI